MMAELRSLCAERSVSGGTLEPLRELADRYGVSRTIAHAVMKSLQDEGLVVSVQGAGTSIVTKRFAQDEVFLFLQTSEVGHPAVDLNQDLAFSGITDRFAELGAFIVAVPGIEALWHIERDAVLKCRGLYGKLYDSLNHRRLFPRLPFPTVGFAEHADPDVDDLVEWDDEIGGSQATHHLLNLGHERIVFFGEMSDVNHWSARRAHGYRQAMTEAGRAHHIQTVPFPQCHWQEISRAARPAALRLAAGPLPDAIVACNDEAAVAVLETFLELGVPLASWPGIIGFDATGIFHNQPISSMRCDGREVGRAAADILWGRAHGELTGDPIKKRLLMQLVPRMTSQQRWAYRLHRLIGQFPLNLK